MSETATPPAAAGSTSEALALVGKYGAKAREQAIKARQAGEQLIAAQTEIAALKAANAKLTGDLDSAVKAAGTPDEKAARIAELEGTIRTGKHKASFAKAAKTAGVQESMVEDLFTVSGYKPDGEPDEAKIGELLTGLKTSKPGYFAPPADATTAAATTTTKTIPGAGRGAANNGGDATIVTREQLADPLFMLSKSNQAAIVQAAKEGRFRG